MFHVSIRTDRLTFQQIDRQIPSDLDGHDSVRHWTYYCYGPFHRRRLIAEPRIANSSGTDGQINCVSADLNLSTTSTPLGSIDGIDGSLPSMGGHCVSPVPSEDGFSCLRFG